ncbi:hypothetical protein VTL71DRAFT_5112 [Oculimacula yallundae]|uniref:Zn(2)-C6 fungal-type domain-containing protein n=1 Tax=Oculimacula yallundae TaxID=86028 RepID=A0ABR4C096_9HELO
MIFLFPQNCFAQAPPFRNDEAITKSLPTLTIGRPAAESLVHPPLNPGSGCWSLRITGTEKFSNRSPPPGHGMAPSGFQPTTSIRSITIKSLHHLPTRPRLRVKTGCAGCRRQKKKCDETKPSCLYCLQYKRECIWPTDFADGRHGRRRASSVFSAPSPTSSSSLSEGLKSPTGSPMRHIGVLQIANATENCDPRSQITWYPVNLGEGQEKLLFHHFSTCTLPTAIRRHAHPLYSKYHDVFHFAFENPDIMSVFLGIAALRISQNNENFAINATKFYNPSVSAVSRYIKGGKVDGTEEWLLVLIAFMVIFETSRFELCSNVMLHLRGLAQVFHIRKLKHVLPDQQRPFHRISAEAFAYHLATYSVLHSVDEIDGVAMQFSWTDLEDYSRLMPFPDASELANSPILGLEFDLFKVVFEITRLSRKTPLKVSDMAIAVEFKEHLDLAQQQLIQDLKLEKADDEHENHKIALLYTLVVEIFLLKVMDPEIDVENLNIRRLLSQALLFLDKCRVYAACNSFFCWPLIVLACAVRTDEQKGLIERKMGECRQWTHSGQIHRSSTIIEAIWKDDLPEASNGDYNASERPRGLDRLLHKEGLVDTLFFTR